MADQPTYLVTGAAGFMGSHVVDRLLAGGGRVEAVDDLSGGGLANLEDARAAGGMRFHQMDIRAPEFVDLVGRVQPDAIFHLAGHVDRPGSLLDPVFDADVNVLGTLNVLEAVRAHEVAATAVVVHGLFRRESDTSGRVIVGQEPTMPSHIAAEAMVDYARVHVDVYGIDVRVVAVSNVYGPRQRAGRHGPVVANFVAAANTGRPMEIQGDGSRARDFLFVDDAADAIVRSLEADSGAVIPVGSGAVTAIGELADLVIGHTDGLAAGVTHGDERTFDRPGVAYPTEDAARRLGWRAWTDLADGIRRTVEHAGD